MTSTTAGQANSPAPPPVGEALAPTMSTKKGGETQRVEYFSGDEKPEARSITSDSDGEKNSHKKKAPKTPRELVSEILMVEDDPSINPWTFRMWFIGIGISVFGGTVTTINTFKPQSIHIHLVFVAVITYLLGTFMAAVLPKRGVIGRFLNPGPFNKKEHSAICIMVAAAAATPEAMMVLAVQKLYYNLRPNPAVSIFLILSTQMLGYGVAGALRKTLVYPSNMLYPTNLPSASLLESLHRDRKAVQKKMKIFYIAFGALFLWQAFPQYIMPLTAGISIFCLSMRDSSFVTTLFGGSMANEGLGFLSFSFDWSMVSAHGNPLWIPFQTLMNTLVGYLLGLMIYMLLYYKGAFDAQNFPFMSTTLFSENSNHTKYEQYNQTLILNENYQVDDAKLAIQGLPRLTTSHAFGMTASNVAIMATITHMILWHWDDIKSALDILKPFLNIFKPKKWDLKVWKHKPTQMTYEEAEAIDPHYALMQSYEDVPGWWFGAIWIFSAVVGLMMSRIAGSTLEVWAFLLAIMISAVATVFYAPLTAMFGFYLNVQPLIQMIGAYVLPGRPLANLYFATFGFNSLYQAKNMLKDLKLGQYVHLAPRCTFTMQIMGTVIGCIMSYINMEQITTEKREILLAIQGTNVWSGQNVQTHNAAAVTWGGLAQKMYGIGARYQMVSIGFLLGIILPIPFWLIHRYVPGAARLRFDYWNVAIICGYLGMLSHGTTSAFLFHFVTGFISQFWLRKYRTNWFIKYNYIMSAGLDGGAQVISFLLTFTVLGASGHPVTFPAYFGNNFNKGNYDYCRADPAMRGGKKHGRKGGKGE